MTSGGTGGGFLRRLFVRLTGEPLSVFSVSVTKTDGCLTLIITDTEHIKFKFSRYHLLIHRQISLHTESGLANTDRCLTRRSELPFLRRNF